MGWYYYLQEKIQFPFVAECFRRERTSPLSVGETVTVKSMAPEDECDHDMYVDVQWNDSELSIPLYQLKGIDVDDDSEEAITDWHYWMNRGYEF
jgi:hypothetical protein